MSKVFFHKHGVNNAFHNRSGQPFKFEKLADAQGVIELDDKENEFDVVDLREWIKKRIGGFSELKTAEEYEAIKKNLSLETNPPARNPNEQVVRLFTAETALDKLAREDAELAKRAKAAGSAEVAGALRTAASAPVEAPSSPKAPRVGKAKKAGDATSEPVAPVAVGTEDVPVRILSDEPVVEKKPAKDPAPPQ